MIKAFWWKITGPLLILGSLLVGLSLPLGPGIYKTDPVMLAKDTVSEVYVYGFNVEFDKAPVAWIKNGKQTICLEDIKVLAHNKSMLKASLNTTRIDATKGIDLIVKMEDGSLAMRDAFIVADTIEKNGSVQCVQASAFVKPPGTYFPFQPLLYETIRNLFYHVPMWFAMIMMLLVATCYSIAYLATNKADYDNMARSLVVMGVIFGALGVFTGMIWANDTWGSPWTSDPKLNGAAIGMIMYLAYLIVRAAIDDEEKRARVAAVANVFFFPMFIVLIIILPRLSDSLHPGNGGNPGFNTYDMDNTMRMIFYPAVIGWILVGFWITSMLYRIKKLEDHVLEA